jgi:hypothetical protein
LHGQLTSSHCLGLKLTPPYLPPFFAGYPDLIR